MMTGEELPGIEYHPVRGFDFVKKAEIEVMGKTLKLAVAAMPKNIRPILRELKKDPSAYDYIEVMACPGGCIGGGGQPIPSTFDIIKKRIAGLYRIDRSESMRKAHENPVVKEFFEYVNAQPKEKRDAILYRTYSKKEKGE
jgi:iron only hydrogenase large subunit-like protein